MQRSSHLFLVRHRGFGPQVLWNEADVLLAEVVEGKLVRVALLVRQNRLQNLKAAQLLPQKLQVQIAVGRGHWGHAEIAQTGVGHRNEGVDEVDLPATPQQIHQKILPKTRE